MINQKFIKMKLASVFLMSIFAGSAYFIIYGPPMRQFKTILQWGDIIESSRGAIVVVFMLPVAFIMMFFAIMNFFNKGTQPYKFSDTFNVITSLIAIITFALGCIATVLFWVAISLSSYTRCDFPTVQWTAWYVTDPMLCQAINTKG